MLLSELMCEVWREVCRHLAIEESAQGIYSLMRPHVPLQYLLLRRWDAARGRLETVGKAGLQLEVASYLDLPSPRQQELLRWASERRVVAWKDREQVGQIGRAHV